MPRTPLLVALACLVAPAPMPAQAPAAAFLERVEVRVAEIDVVVLDGDGQRVRGLGRDDFELLEDGKAVEIANFLAYDEGATPAGDAPSPAAATGGAEPAAGVPAPPANWLFYLDSDRLEPPAVSQVLRQFASFLASGLRPGDRALVAVFDGSSLKVTVPLTSDPAAVAHALEQFRAKRGFASQYALQRGMLQRQILQVDASAPDADVEADSLRVQIDYLAEQEAESGRAEVGALRDLLSLAAGLEGRVAVLAAGAGFDTRPGEALYRLWDAKFAGLAVRHRANADLDERWTAVRREQGRLLAAVNGGRFTFYTVQAGGFRGPDLSAEIPGAAGRLVPGGADDSALRMGGSLAELASETGGRTFAGTPDLAQRLAAARQDLASYYSLGYHPQGDEPGRRRRIEVRVRREGLRVLVRSQVTDPAAADRLSDTAVAALLEAGDTANPMRLTVEVLPPPAAVGKRGDALVPVVVHVPVAQITLLPEGARHLGRLVFQFALQDADGGYRRLESRPLAFDVPNDKLATALSQSISFRIEIALAPGSYRIAAAVLDELAGTLSAATTPVRVAAR